MKISRKMKKVCGLVLSLALVSSFIVIGVGGNSGGRFNVAQTGCGNGCHGPEDPTITVLINGLPVEYTPTQAYALTIDVSGGPATTRGGFNLEVTAGTLSSADVNVLIDTPPVQAAHENEDARSWSLDWTAPTSGTGDVTLYLAGMAAGDGARKQDGDSWKLYSTVVPESVPANTPPTIDLTYPDGGQDWTGGFAKRIWWNMSDAEDTDNTQLKVWVNYSVDSGASWTPIAGAQNIAGVVNPNSYDWTVPTIDTNLARINVTVQDTGGLRTRDTSLADFTIDSTPPTVILTNPLHGEINVPTNANYEMTFSEPMNQNSAENAFELYNTFDWSLVNGVFEPWVGNMMIFNPGGNLAPGMLYSANISSILNRAYDDSDPGNEMAFEIFIFFTVDDAPPEVSEVLIDNQPIRTVPAGTIVTLNATINDVWTGFSNISAANYTIGWQDWASTVSMNAEDGAFDQVLERVTVTIDTAGWIDGTYDIYVYGSDDVPNHNTTSIQHAILIVSSDYNAPEVSNVMINGAATQTYPLSSIPTLTLTATIDDVATGNSNITGANYTEGDSNWPGTDMNAADGTFDSPTEDVTIDIAPAPTVPGTYYYYVYGWDDKFNYNITSTAYATLTIQDDDPPEVLNVQVDGQPSVTVQPGATVILTATIDDTGTGGSIIGGANNTTGPANWATSAPMIPISPPLDSPIEDFIQAIDTTGWLTGSYDMYVYGWDDAAGSNSTSQAFATIIISADTQKPEIFNVLIDGLPTATVFISSLPPTMTLTATIDDTMAGGSNIAGANYTTPTMTSFPGTDMNAVLPPFDSIIEDVTATITTPTLAGTYNYYVYAWDEYLNANTTAPYATLIVIDDMQPQISNVLIDGLATATYGLSVMPQTVGLSATISDSATGNSMISGANFTTPTATSWPGISMYPTGEAPPVWDDEVTEDVNATIDISGYAPGSYVFYVYAWDEVGNYNTTAPFATLTIFDDVPPQISNVLIDGLLTTTVFEGTDVTLNATIDDALTGGSDIFGANYTLGAQIWPGIDMTAIDGAFDSLTEAVTVTIDTTGMDGTYEVYVYGWDGATPTSNYNMTSTAYATLVVNPSPVNAAPTLDWTGETNYVSDGLNPETGRSSTVLNYRVKYTDSDGNPPAANNPRLHIRKGGTEITGSPFTMIHESGLYDVGAIYSYSISLAEGNDYSYYFTASDNQGAPATPTTEIFAPYVSDVDATPPDAPINLVVSSSDEEGELELSWDSNTEPDLDGYDIYRSTTSYEDSPGGTGYEFVESVSESRTTYTDTGLDDGRTYYYVITAIDSSENESPFSNEASGTTKSITDKEAPDYLWLWVFLAILAGVNINLFLVLWARKRKREQEEPTEEEETTEEEESSS